jgi:site-specific DNA-methyltransferase (adenine-specific)
MSNPKMFKYCWVWDKKIPSGMSYARYQPMRQHEDIVVFCEGRTAYNAQKVKRTKPIKSGGINKSLTAPNTMESSFKKTYHEKNPVTIIQFDKVRKGSQHPTQKPVALMEYLIKTYTNEGDLVLDNVAGSGTTGVAAMNTNRNFILMEQEPEYVEIIKQRLAGHDVTPIW